MLLVGPPGTGKTLLARATAGEADAAFFSASGAEFVESLVGVGAARIRDLFAKARKTAPAIVFIDELDAAGRKRGAGVGQGNDEREQTLNQLLVEMDGFGGDAGVCRDGRDQPPGHPRPGAAAARPLRPPGRRSTSPTCTGASRSSSCTPRAAASPPTSTSREIAKLCPGFSGAELANLVNEAALLSVREGFSEIDQATLEEAIDRVVAGPAKKTHVLTEDERWRIAIHEAGHAVATRAIGQVVSAQKLSIVARGRQLGTAAHMLTDRDAVMHAAVRPRAPPGRDPRRHRRRADRVRRGLDRRDRRPARGDQAGPPDGHLLRDEPGARLGDDRRGRRRGLPRRLAAGPRLGRPPHARRDRRRDRAHRRGGQGPRRCTCCAPTGTRSRRRREALLEHETLSGVALDAVLATVEEIEIEEIPLPEPQARRGSQA